MTSWLTGKRVVVTRAASQAAELCERLAALGAVPIAFPVIAVVPAELGGPLDDALARLAAYDWIVFTSANGVICTAERLAALADRSAASSARDWTATGQTGDLLRSRLGRCRVAAIGPATAAALRALGVHVDLVPGQYRSEAILQEIGSVAGLRILLPRADIAPPDLARGLRGRGAIVDEVAAYRTVPTRPAEDRFDALRNGVDVVTFTSASTVRNFVALTDGLDYGDPVIACIGPVTADAARAFGLRVEVVARDHTVQGLVEALVHYRP